MRHILCVGMYRACSTWQYEVVSHLVEARLGGKRLGFLDGDAFSRAVATAPGETRIGVLKSHDYHTDFARSLKSGQATAIYAYRDLRDVAYSYMHKASLSFDELVSLRFIPKVLRNDRLWRSQPGILIQRYETILTDLAGGVRELAEHLGVRLTESETSELAREYSWQSNFLRALEVRRHAEAAGVDLEDRTNTYRQDPVTLLHWNHLRTRRSTGWRDLSSTAQRETLAYLCGDWLIENGYETDRDWVTSPNPSSRGVLEDQPLPGSGPVEIEHRSLGV